LLPLLSISNPCKAAISPRLGEVCSCLLKAVFHVAKNLSCVLLNQKAGDFNMWANGGTGGVPRHMAPYTRAGSASSPH